MNHAIRFDSCRDASLILAHRGNHFVGLRCMVAQRFLRVWHGVSKLQQCIIGLESTRMPSVTMRFVTAILLRMFFRQEIAEHDGDGGTLSRCVMI